MKIQRAFQSLPIVADTAARLAAKPEGKALGPMTNDEWAHEPKRPDVSDRAYARQVRRRERQIEKVPFEPVFVRAAGMVFQETLAKTGDRDAAWESARAYLAKHPTQGWRIADKVEFKTINGAGGAFFRMAVLYAGPKGYIAGLESTIGTDGPSGRYRGMRIYDTVLAGHLKIMGTERRDYTVNAGDTGYLAAGDSHAFRAEVDPSSVLGADQKGVYILEQGVGGLFTSGALRFGMLEPMGPMGDKKNGIQQFKEVAKSMLHQIKNKPR